MLPLFSAVFQEFHKIFRSSPQARIFVFAGHVFNRKSDFVALPAEHGIEGHETTAVPDVLIP